MKSIPTGEIIVITGFQLGTASSHDKAIKLRDEIVKDAQELPAITTPEIALATGETLRALTTFSAQIEVARETAKAPVLERGRAIDALAKSLTEDVNAQIKRVKALLGAWTEEQDKKAAEVQRLAFEAEEKIRKDAEAAEEQKRVELEAEKKRIADKADADAQALIDRANAAKSPEARDNLLAKADEIRTTAEMKLQSVEDKANDQAAARDDALTQRVGEVRHSVTLATPGKVAGFSGKKVPCYEVLDIDQVYKANPLFVKLTPADGIIKKAIEKLKAGEKIPGLRHWFENSGTVRNA